MKSLTVLAFTLILAAPGFAQDAKEVYEETLDQSFPLAAGGSFTLTNTSGSIEVNAWDKNEVRIVAVRRMRLDDDGWWLARLIGIKQTRLETDAEAKGLFEKLRVEFGGDGAARMVTTHYPDAKGVNFQVNYRISAPKTVKIGIKNVNGGIELNGVAGGATLETTSGSVSVADARGPLRVETTNGRVTLERVSGAITAGTTNGSLTVRLLEAVTVENIDLKSVNGSVKLYVPSTAGFHLEARTVNGSVDCDLPLASVTQQSRKRLEGVVGVAGAHVELGTTNGRVLISNAS